MTVPSPRPVFDAIPGYKAGRPAEHDELKLSSNENPFPPLPGVVERAGAELARVNRYPDAGVARLHAALSQHLARPEEAFAAGTGSVAVLFSLLDAYCGPGDEVVTAWRSFEAYPIAVTVTGATHVTVPLRADHTHDLDAMAAAVTDRTRVVVVCTPNNPTGPVVRHDELERFVAALPPSVLVVVDEAYVEFVRDPDAARGLDLQARFDNVLVLRTFSKAYGLAGLRVGYLVGHPDVAAAVRKATPPFSVTDVAQAAAVASLDAADELAARVDDVVQGRGLLLEGLRAQGWTVPDTQANFVWLPSDQGPQLAEAFWPVAVRPFPGAATEGGGVRVSVGTTSANERLLDVAARHLTGR
ncbi:MAG: histidinol-phosphate transaminase [Propionibacteriales bacterium]|nr:histidinol-phosphate transaminase [Propionibacteriales bacterium]